MRTKFNSLYTLCLLLVFLASQGAAVGQTIDLELDIDAPVLVETNQPEEVVFTLSNHGPDTATGLAVSVSLPPDAIIESSDPNFDTLNNIILFEDLAPGSAAISTLMLSFPEGSNTIVAEVTNAVEDDIDSSPNNDDGDQSEDDEAIAEIVSSWETAIVDLSLFVFAGSSGTFQIGDTFTYTVEVSNDGPDDAQNVVVQHSIPQGTTYVSDAPSQGDFTPATGLWELNELSVGSTAIMQITVTFEQEGEIPFIAQVVSSDLPDIDSEPNNDDGDQSEDDEDDLVIEVTGASGTADLEVDFYYEYDGYQTLTYFCEVSNTGTLEAENVEALLDVPSHQTWVSSSATSGTYLPLEGKWEIGTVPQGMTTVMEVQFVPTEAGEFTASFQISECATPDSDSSPGNSSGVEDDEGLISDSIELPATYIDLSLELTSTGSIATINQQGSLVIEVSNQGPDDASGVAITCTLPADLIFISATDGQYQALQHQWSIANVFLAAGQTNQYIIDAEAINATGTALVLAEVTACDQEDVDSNPGNSNGTIIEDGEDDEAGLELQFTQAINDLDLSVSSAVTEVEVGSYFDYVITVTNQGPDDCFDLELWMELPEGISYVGGIASTGLYLPDEHTWEMDMMAAGSTETLEMTLLAEVGGSYELTSELIAHSGADIDSTPGNNDPLEDDQDQLSITCFYPPCSEPVWPGDTNHDGVADNFDLLNLGIAYGITGPARQQIGIDWLAYEAPCFDGEFEDGINHNHADCDGNGIVSSLDEVAITQNYGLTHEKNGSEQEATEDDPRLFLIEPEELTAGMFLSLPIELGTVVKPVEEVYGLAFTVRFENITFLPGTFEVDFGDCWMSSEGSELLTLDYLIQENFEVDIALTRTDLVDKGGFGPVCSIHGMIDDIAGKQNADYSFSIVDVQAITSKSETSPIYVDAATSNEQPELTPNLAVEVYPNPAAQHLIINANANTYQQYTLFDSNGRVVKEGNLGAVITEIFVEDLLDGLYLLRCQGKQSSTSVSIAILR